MSQNRIERVVNLIAYLSDSRRSLTLREIVETVPGYPENFVSARKAFGRDKEDLIAMGFDVVLELTPNGDSGYRISRDTTYFDIDLGAVERNIIDYALEQYSPEEKLAKNAISKIGANNPENALQGIRSLPLPTHLNAIFFAISKQQVLKVLYKGKVRYLAPKKLIAKSGFWYLQASDLEKKANRVFRLDRIEDLQVDEEVYIDIPKDLKDPVVVEQEALEISVKVADSLSARFAQTWLAKSRTNEQIFDLLINNQLVFLSSIFDYSGFVAVVEPKEIVSDIEERFIGVLNQLKGVS